MTFIVQYGQNTDCNNASFYYRMAPITHFYNPITETILQLNEKIYGCFVYAHHIDELWHN